MPVKANVVVRTTIAPIDACVNVTAKSPVRCARHPAKFSADTPNVARNARNPVHHALKDALGPSHTVGVVRCLALYRATFFLARKDAGKRSAAAIDAHRYAMKSAPLQSIVKSALLNLPRSRPHPLWDGLAPF